MIFKLKIMSQGDKVLNCWDDKVAILRVNGEVDILQIILEDGQLPRISEHIWRVTYGNNTIEIAGNESLQSNYSVSTHTEIKTEENTASLAEELSELVENPDEEVSGLIDDNLKSSSFDHQEPEAEEEDDDDDDDFVISIRHPFYELNKRF